MRMSADRWTAIVFLVLVLIYGAESETHHKVLQADIMGPRFFPRVLALMGLALAAWLFWSGTREETRTGGLLLGQEAEALVPLGMLAAYALLLQPLGFIGCTFAYLAASFKLLGQPSWTGSVAFGLVFTAAIFLLFDVLLGIPLPHGEILGNVF